MNVIIDVGNTLYKFAIFDGETLVEKQGKEKQEVMSYIKHLVKSYPKLTHCILSSVGALSKEEIAALEQSFLVHVLSYQSIIPFVNQYKTPTTLGVDRIALIAAAAIKFPEQNVLVIDAGSAITYDFLTTHNQYLGGAIAPGLAMRYKSLHTFTENLPLLEKTVAFSMIGDSTECAMHSGVIQGVIFEIDGMINEYKQQYTELTIILTGGDAHFLRDRLKNDIFANSNFLLEGLNYISELNKD
ncbi:MAG: type III pantothenate kinase [Patiriisocius sp.]|jgi:type III pantothenate kinase